MAGCGFSGVLFAFFLCTSLALTIQEIVVLSFVNKHWCSKECFQLEHDEKIKLSETLQDIFFPFSFINF